ncbi:MAG: penicillin-binding transpeptidase domain-containing protein, partial [Actinocrinis sp.]
TFNKHYMDLAQQAVHDQLLSKLSSKNWYDQNLKPALAAVDPKTGNLVAFYGGTDSFNWAVQGQVQPGSTFKAFTLATAFQQNYSPNSFIDGSSPWPAPGNAAEQAAAAHDPQVKNDDGSKGIITLNTATAESVNTAFVRLANQVTYNDVMKTVNQLGITDHNAQGLRADARLTLGIASVSPARMAAAYSAFANNGSQYPLIEVKEIKNSDGTDWKPNAKPNQVLDPNVAETVTQTLAHVTHDTDGTGYGSVNGTGLDNIAGKTGTSTMDLANIQAHYPDIYDKTRNGYYTTSAVWFNGYTSNLETAVAISRSVPEKDPKTGATVYIPAPVDNINGNGFSFGASNSLPIWEEFMKLMQGTKSAYVGDPKFPTPNLSGMKLLNSPSASPSPSATKPSTTPSTPGPGNGHGNHSFSPSPTATLSSSPTSSPSCQPSLFNPCNGGGGGGGSTPSTTPSATATATKKGIGGGIGG